MAQSKAYFEALLEQEKKKGDKADKNKIAKLNKRISETKKAGDTTNVAAGKIQGAFPKVMAVVAKPGKAEDKAFNTSQRKILNKDKKEWIAMIRKRNPKKSYDELSKIWDKDKKK